MNWGGVVNRFSSILGSLLAMSALSVSAAPVYVTFEGSVSNSTAQGYVRGQAVRYYFMVDHDLDGYTIENGVRNDLSDYVGDDYTIDFLQTDYLGGDAMAADLPGAPEVSEFHYGYSYSYFGSPTSVLGGSNFDPSGSDYLYIFSTQNLFESWAVGQAFSGVNYNTGADGRVSVSSALTLTGISGTNPIQPAVPEPSSLCLMGLGILGLATGARKIRPA
jgi:hypothetical protein